MRAFQQVYGIVAPLVLSDVGQKGAICGRIRSELLARRLPEIHRGVAAVSRPVPVSPIPWEASPMAEDPALQALAAQSLMRRHGVSNTEAVRRLNLQDAAMEIADELDDLLGDYSGELWFDHEDSGRLKIGVARREGCERVCSQVEQLLAQHDLSDHAAIVQVDYSYEDLRLAQQALDQELLPLFEHGKVSSGLRPDLNAVEVRIAANASADEIAYLRRLAAQAPARVIIEQTNQPTLFMTKL